MEQDDEPLTILILIDFQKYNDLTPECIVLMNHFSKKMKSKNWNIKSFEDLELRFGLLRGIYDYGFEKILDIQKKCIVPMMCNPRVDICVRASSGTGKTSSYTIALLNRIDLNLDSYTNGCPQAFILVPTRELAQSVSKLIDCMGRLLKVKTLPILGLGGMGKQTTDYLQNEKFHVMVGTPGRTLDLVRRGFLNLNHLKMLIIDEMDEILERGFEEYIYDIFTHAKFASNKQTCCFSSSISTSMQVMINKELGDQVLYVI